MPLVDVMLVLLIIFMVTAPMIQRGVDVNLPVSRRRSGQIGHRHERVFVTVPAAYRQNRDQVFLDDEQIRVDAAAGAHPPEDGTRGTDKQVFLRGDARALDTTRS